METVIVCGLGEIGKPIYSLCEEEYDTIGLDPAVPASYKDPRLGKNPPVKVLHLNYPGALPDYVDISVDYVKRFRPELTVVNSSTIPGTTRKIYARTKRSIVHSPVQGKHRKNMLDEIRAYQKQLGPIDQKSYTLAKRHFEKLGVKTLRASSPEASEWQKVLCTTAFGLFIAWAQELERVCDEYGLKYDDLTVAYKNADFIFPHYSGVIGGHCVLPNIDLIKKIRPSKFVDLILESNRLKMRRERKLRKGLPKTGAHHV